MKDYALLMKSYVPLFVLCGVQYRVLIYHNIYIYYFVYNIILYYVNIFSTGKGKASLKKVCANVTCSSCTFQVRGDFCRCVECSIYGSSGSQLKLGNLTDEPKPVDFCKTCFKNIGRSHAKHHFLSSSTNSTVRDFAWQYVKNPRAPQQLISVDVLENLQNRDITTADYEFLLDLDKPKVLTIQDTILNAMKICTSKSNLVKCWCGADVTSDTAKALLCGHVVHIECCREKLNEAIEEGFWKLEEMKCPHLDCECPLFRGLGRRRKKIVKDETHTDARVSGRDGMTSFNGFVIAGSGIGAAAETGRVAPLYNDNNGLAIALEPLPCGNRRTRRERRRGLCTCD